MGNYRKSNCVEIICDFCGGRFQKEKRKIKKRNFCSRECYWKAMRKERARLICDYCGQPIEKYMNKVTKNNFCSRTCHMKFLNAELNPNRMTDEIKEKIRKARIDPNRKGYKKIYGMHEHRIIAEKMLGRKLKQGEVVHHINRDRSDNRPENLMVFSSQAEHVKWHVEHDEDWGGGVK